MHKIILFCKQKEWDTKKAIALNAFCNEIYYIEECEEWDTLKTWEELEPILDHFEMKCNLENLFYPEISFKVFNEQGELVCEGSI